MLPHTGEGAFTQTAIELVSVTFHIRSDYAASKQVLIMYSETFKVPVYRNKAMTGTNVQTL